jgi:hypothetical protein
MRIRREDSLIKLLCLLLLVSCSSLKTQSKNDFKEHLKDAPYYIKVAAGYFENYDIEVDSRIMPNNYFVECRNNKITLNERFLKFKKYKSLALIRCREGRDKYIKVENDYTKFKEFLNENYSMYSND